MPEDPHQGLYGAFWEATWEHYSQPRLFPAELPKVMPRPNRTWVVMLREDDMIWLSKQNEYAYVEWEYQRGEKATSIGRLGIKRWNSAINRWIGESWFVDAFGQGLDGTTIIQPTEACFKPQNRRKIFMPEELRKPPEENMGSRWDEI